MHARPTLIHCCIENGKSCWYSLIFFLPRGKMNQFCFWRFLPSNQTLPPCWCIIGESVLFFSSSSTSILLLIQKSWLLTSVAFPPHIKTGVYRETIQWAAVLCENILLMSEENGQSVSSWQKGSSNSNNHLLQPRHAGKHLWMQKMSNLEADGLQYQKNTLGATSDT